MRFYGITIEIPRGRIERDGTREYTVINIPIIPVFWRKIE